MRLSSFVVEFTVSGEMKVLGNLKWHADDTDGTDFR